MKPTEKQLEIINRLLVMSKTQVNACLKALSEDTNEQDIKYACYLASLNGIK